MDSNNSCPQVRRKAMLFRYRVEAIGPEEMGNLPLPGLVVARNRKQALKKARDECHDRIGFAPDHWIPDDSHFFIEKVVPAKK